MVKNEEQTKLYYVVGYGRMGSTLLAKNLAWEHEAMNLGEMKYLFSGKKDDLLSEEWRKFKKNIPLRNRLIVRFCDSCFGMILFPGFKKVYSESHKIIFASIGHAKFVDSSKTTFDVVFRPYNLAKCGFNVSLVKSDVGYKSVLRSMWLKGKNSTIERHGIDRLRHFTFTISVIHLLLTELFVGFLEYKIYRMEDLKSNIELNGLPKSLIYNSNIVYGNRNR